MTEEPEQWAVGLWNSAIEATDAPIRFKQRANIAAALVIQRACEQRVAEERERCAKVAEQTNGISKVPNWPIDGAQIANAIRGRNNP